MNEDIRKKEKIADVLSKYVDSLNRGDSPSISKILAENSDITDVLAQRLEFSQIIYKQLVMKHAPEDFKKRLLNKLLTEMVDIMQEKTAEIHIEEVIKNKWHLVLQYLRQKSKKSIDQVSEEIGVNKNTLNTLEEGKKIFISPRLWWKLAKVYKVDVRELGIVLGKVNWRKKPSKITLAAQYHGEDLTDEEKELINKFFSDRKEKKNEK